MKALLPLFIILFSFMSQAQTSSNETRNMAEDVDFLVQNHLQSLPPKSRQYVKDSLRNVIKAFAMSGFEAPGNQHGNPPLPPPPQYPSRNLFCDFGNNTLHDGNTGSMIHDFSSKEDCSAAQEFVSRGEPFCDYSNNTLYTPDGRLIHDFSSKEDCRKGREAVLNGRGFCDFDNNTLYNSMGRLIYDFSSATDCQAALNKQTY